MRHHGILRLQGLLKVLLAVERVGLGLKHPIDEAGVGCRGSGLPSGLGKEVLELCKVSFTVLTVEHHS